MTRAPRLKRIIADHLWWVTDDLAREAPSRAERTAAERYAFLASGIPLPLDDRTSVFVLALEERVREILGLIDLSHSHYYSNKEVIAGIARFIAAGEVPPGIR